MGLGTIVKASRQPPDAVVPHQPQQSHAHGVRRAEIKKILGREHPRLPVLPDTSGDGLCQIHGFKCAPNMLKKQPCFFNSLNGIKVSFSVSVIHGKSSSTRYADSERDS